jgi:Spy/CpxP family protein refolding chaperone
MARHSRRVLATLAVAIGAILTAEARGSQTEAAKPQQPNPQGRDGRRDQSHECRPWWKEAKCVAEIGITSEQSATIDAIFKSEIEKMKPLRDSINQLERELNDTVRANTTEVAAFTRQVQKIEKMRAELNTMRTVMLYRMRRVLTNDQHAKLTAMLERRDAERRKQDSDRHH